MAFRGWGHVQRTKTGQVSSTLERLGSGAHGPPSGACTFGFSAPLSHSLGAAGSEGLASELPVKGTGLSLGDIFLHFCFLWFSGKSPLTSKV